MLDFAFNIALFCLDVSENIGPVRAKKILECRQFL